ncbi:uncharacterized protein LOC101852337 [Aplysia californica]|uniref:Centromere protein M n=1 Tax=Aplysia californica TaxID=6500 RepID=A0ABM0JVQ8_APLCA|nr:uncharacterized protein LOC101852337 [Aplysia californica]
MEINGNESESNNLSTSQNEGLSSKIIRPHHVLRNIYSPQTLLVVASEGCLTVPDDLKTFTEGDNGVLVRYTKSLPLESGNKSAPIDAIALVYKVFSGDSLKTIKDSLPFIDVRYFLGKCFILVVSGEDFCPKDTYEIEQFASQYHLPIHFASLIKGSGQSRPVLQVPSHLLSVYCPPVGCDVSRLIIDATIVKTTADL